MNDQVKEKKSLLQTLPSGDEELYSRFKKLEAHREFLSLQEASASRLGVGDPLLTLHIPFAQEYILYETHNLRRELLRAQEEVKRIKSVPLVIGQFLEAVDNTRGIVQSTTGQSPITAFL